MDKKPASTTAQHLSLPVSDSSYMNYRARIKEIKQKEYKDYIGKVAHLNSCFGSQEMLEITWPFVGRK